MTALTVRPRGHAAESAAAKQAEHDKGWTPRRRGEIYCSPRCGGKCTHAAFEAAHRKANALCKRLGAGWEPCVWENLGWHFSAQKGVATLRVNEYRLKGKVTTHYTVYFNSIQQTVETADTPEDALRSVGRTLALVGKDWQKVMAP